MQYFYMSMTSPMDAHRIMEKVKIREINIGSIIREKLFERGMSIADFARAINCHRTNVYDLFARRSVNIELLLKISQVLDYDFILNVYYRHYTGRAGSGAATAPKPELEKEGVTLTIVMDTDLFEKLACRPGLQELLGEHPGKVECHKRDPAPDLPDVALRTKRT